MDRVGVTFWGPDFCCTEKVEFAKKEYSDKEFK